MIQDPNGRLWQYITFEWRISSADRRCRPWKYVDCQGECVKEAPLHYALRERNKRSGPSWACVQAWDWTHSVVSHYRLRMHLLEVSFISWRWQKRLLPPPHTHPTRQPFMAVRLRPGCPVLPWYRIELCCGDLVNEDCSTLTESGTTVRRTWYCTRACWLKVFL